MECPICLEKCESYIKLKCDHKFHFKCIKDWSQSSTKCPLCRKFMGYYCLDNSNSEMFPKFSELYCINLEKNINSL